MPSYDSKDASDAVIQHRTSMLASVTRLRVRSLRFLPSFLWHTFRTQRQVVDAPSFIGGRLLIDSRLTFWTLTVWESEASMRKFRSSGAHARVMPRLLKWCDEAAYAHWEENQEIPSWEQAHERLVVSGKLSRVEHPSQRHLEKHFPKPRLQPLIGNDLKPKSALKTGF